jgi:uncharacterized protein (TIGR00156 family)
MRRLLLALAVALFAVPAAAQFRGPSLTGFAISVADVRDAPLGNSVAVTGHILNHVQGNSYTFEDKTGRIRVQIDSALWKGRLITPKTRVRLTAEVVLARYGRALVAKRIEIVS